MDKTQVKYPGIEYRFNNDAVLVIPPLSYRTWKLHREKIQGMTGTADDADTIGLILFETLRRNYPDITQDEVDDLIDFGNMDDVFAAIMDVGGLKRKAQEAEKGEAKPGQKKK